MEEIITLATARWNRIGCAEVTLDDEGIVDYICMDLNGERIVRCYELKITKSDFLSDAKKTFIGDFNYYVIPAELWMDVRNYVEPGIGVWLIPSTGSPYVKKKATRRVCSMDKKQVLGKIMKALNRENLKHATEKWRARKLATRIKDRNGLDLNVGDIVEYRSEMFEIIEIDYVNQDLNLVATCLMSSVDDGREEQISPGIVKRVKLSDIISAPIVFNEGESENDGKQHG